MSQNGGEVLTCFQIDKSTLGYAAILGLFEETGITKAQYNDLGTFFYVGMFSPFLEALPRLSHSPPCF
jgi:hypothetical protein